MLRHQRVVVALQEPVRLMAEIDQVIESHGSRPGAFITEKQSQGRGHWGHNDARRGSVAERTMLVPFPPS
jgi:hypothetical protein